MDVRQLLGKRIKAIRGEMHISQEEMAFRCGTHASHIGQLERGERNPTLETLEGIALGLNISLSELVSFDLEPDVEVHDALTNRITSYVLGMSEAEKKQLLTIVKALARRDK